MIGRCRGILILLTLVLAGARALGAGSADKNFDAAARSFQNGFYFEAARDFKKFVGDYPDSPRVAEAILYWAEASITNRQFTSAIALLTTNEFRAGPYRDQYRFWIAHAHFRNGEYAAAAHAFETLLADFPASSNRFDSLLGAATALSKIEQWPRVITLLQDTNGVFQQTARSGQPVDGIATGYLLLGEAQLALTNYTGVETALQSLDRLQLKPDLGWRRFYLQCRLQAAQGRPEVALQNTTNLFALAAAANDRRLQADTTVLEAGLLERLSLLDRAIASWQANLSASAPVEQQAHAMLRIAALSLKLNRAAEAVQMLQRYLDQRPAGGAVDLAVLTIGELQLRQYLGGAGTNNVEASASGSLLQQASEHFDTVLTTWTNSPWIGKALLDKGWCLWVGGRVPQSEEPFRLAAGRLPFSEDQAVARFKWGDARFMQGDYNGALTNYLFLVSNYTALPGVRAQILERALYQTVRAALEVTNLPAATDALQKILDWYPEGFAGDRSLLLVGQGLTEQNDAVAARKLFADFEAHYPDSPLLRELRLAIARTYEQEGNWTAAITNYEAWLAVYTNSAELLPRAEFSLARATSLAGLETNALTRFTNFVVNFSASNPDLAATAQWCVASYYYGQADFYNAERSFSYLFRTWPGSELACEAEMRAGRAAMARGHKDAIGYFAELYTNRACSDDLKIEAAFWAGDACLARISATDSTNRVAYLEEALDWFERIRGSYPTSAQVPLACIKIGNCNLQWAALDPQKYVAASNAYQDVLTLTNSTRLARDQARIALAVVAEKQADLKSGEERSALLAVALNHCLEVMYSSADEAGEKADAHLLSEAGNRAGSLAEKMNQWQQAVNVYTDLARLLPVLSSSLEKKIHKAQEHLNGTQRTDGG